jgi:hypothetical protein
VERSCVPMSENRIEGAALQGEDEVKPSLTQTAMKTETRAPTKEHRANFNVSNRPVRARMPGGVVGEEP